MLNAEQTNGGIGFELNSAHSRCVYHSPLAHLQSHSSQQHSKKYRKVHIFRWTYISRISQISLHSRNSFSAKVNSPPCDPYIFVHCNLYIPYPSGDAQECSQSTVHGFSDIWEFLKHAGGRCFLLLARGSREYH